MNQEVNGLDPNNFDEEENMNEEESVERFDWNSKFLTIGNCGDKLGDNLMAVLIAIVEEDVD